MHVIGRWLWFLQATAMFLALCGAPLAAQTTDQNVLVIDPETLFQRTLYGRRIIQEFEVRADTLSQENRAIEAALTDEEKELTERRSSVDVDEFRTLADAFDEKVGRIRAEQDAKARDLQRARDSGQQAFFAQVGPIILELTRARNGALVLDRRSVFLSSPEVDITQDAISAIDEALGDGTR